eukprot:5127695-Pleurochrysis_carterae.AAC.2
MEIEDAGFEDGDVDDCDPATTAAMIEAGSRWRLGGGGVSGGEGGGVGGVVRGVGGEATSDSGGQR